MRISLIKIRVAISSSFILIKTHHPMPKYKNQSVENTGVAFIKGANEKNESFEKVNKQ